jgi:hypothetical protein
MAAELQGPTVDLELVAGNAGGGPGGVGQQRRELGEQELQDLAARRQGARDAEHELDVQRRAQQPAVQQLRRVVQHGQVEDLDLRLDVLRQHGAGQLVDQRRRVLVDPVREVDRTGRQGRHVGLEGERRAAVGAAPAPPAGRELHDHAWAVPLDALLDLGEEHRVRGRLLLGVADMDVDERRPGLEGLVGRLDLLGRRHGHGRIVRLARHRTGDRHGDDGWSGHGTVIAQGRTLRERG